MIGTYNIPRIAQVTMSSHEESHGYNFQDHFKGVDEQKYQINIVCNLGDAFELFVECEEQAVSKNDPEDDPVEPIVNGHNLNNLVPERIRHRQATQ